MRKTIKKFLTIALAAVLAVTAFTPVTAQAESTIFAPETLTYCQPTKGSTFSTTFTVSGLSKSDIIKKSSVKSSKPSVAKVVSLKKTKTSTSSTCQYYSKEPKTSQNSNSYTYDITVQFKKPGTSIIYYKVNNKTYKTKIKLCAYENPIKTLTVTGVKNGKNLANSFKTGSQYHNGKLTKNISSGKVKVTAKNNWKITKVSFSNHSLAATPGPYGGSTHESLETLSRYYRNGKSSVTLNVKSLKKNKAYYVNVEMINTKTGATMYVAYGINSHLFR